MKVVGIVTPSLHLGFAKFIKETPLKYKYEDPDSPGWTWYVKKEEADYFGEETDQVKAIKQQYDEAEDKIKALREYQEQLVQRLKDLPTNEAPGKV